MIIASSQMAMSSKHSLVEQESRQESLRFWKDGGPSQAGTVLSVQVREDQVSISAQAQSLMAAQTQTEASVAPAEKSSSIFELSDADKQKIALLEQMLKMLTGKKVKLRVMDPAAWAKRQQVNINWQPGSSVQVAAAPAAAPARKGWGLEYDLHETRFEQE